MTVSLFTSQLKLLRPEITGTGRYLHLIICYLPVDFCWLSISQLHRKSTTDDKNQFHTRLVFTLTNLKAIDNICCSQSISLMKIYCRSHLSEVLKLQHTTKSPGIRNLTPREPHSVRAESGPGNDTAALVTATSFSLGLIPVLKPQA